MCLQYYLLIIALLSVIRPSRWIRKTLQQSGNLNGRHYYWVEDREGGMLGGTPRMRKAAIPAPGLGWFKIRRKDWKERLLNQYISVFERHTTIADFEEKLEVKASSAELVYTLKHDEKLRAAIFKLLHSHCVTSAYVQEGKLWVTFGANSTYRTSLAEIVETMYLIAEADMSMAGAYSSSTIILGDNSKPAIAHQPMPQMSPFASRAVHEYATAPTSFPDKK